MPYPCGWCLPCRINRRRLWTHRLILESKCHEQNGFLTLTYDDDHLPEGGSLEHDALSGFVKRLRENRKRDSPVADHRFRFFGVGEYGSRKFRPHYHLCLFGVGFHWRGSIEKSWTLGGLDFRALSPELAQYCCGYTVEKLTKPCDSRLGGRHPEYARMSNRPGLGALYVRQNVAAVLNTSVGAQTLASDGDVPAMLRHGSRLLPLGRYLRKELRDACGFDTLGQQVLPEAIRAAEVQALRDGYDSITSYRRAAPYIDQQKILQIEGRADINKKVSKL